MDNIHDSRAFSEIDYMDIAYFNRSKNSVHLFQPISSKLSDNEYAISGEIRLSSNFFNLPYDQQLEGLNTLNETVWKIEEIMNLLAQIRGRPQEKKSKLGHIDETIGG